MSEEHPEVVRPTGRNGLPDMSRRNFLAAGGLGAAGLLLGGRAGSLFESHLRDVAKARVASASKVLGLAPAQMQFYSTYNNSVGQTYKALDFYETVYSRAPNADLFNIGLVRLNNNFKLVPGAAQSWSQTSPTTWEFKIRPGIMWSDGNELTAKDFVETFRYSADPKHAWDFSWYWSGIIKNYTEAVAGKAPLSSLGVGVGKDKYTFVVTTEAPIAYMPNAMLYSYPLSAAGLAKYGNGLYNIDPATCITCGPYTLRTFDPTAHVVLQPNRKYTAPFKPYIQYPIAKIYSGTYQVPLFETGEVDTVQSAPPNTQDGSLYKSDLETVKTMPKINKLPVYMNPQDFRIYYVAFKTKKKPFTDPRVRQAFAHAVNRQALISSLLAPVAVPAYGYLAPGYPFAVSKPLEKYTNYDTRLAQKLLADAGYPGGKNFPTTTLSYPAAEVLSSTLTGSVVQALVATWNAVLFNGNPTILLQELDNTTFYSKMEAHPTQLDMAFCTYGMDYFDASNMLSVYKSGGRHDWDNAQYDNLLAQGAAQSNPAKRQEIYTEAQTLLTKDAPGVFLWHGLYAFLYWPFVQGPALAKNDLGYDGVEWPGYISDMPEQLWIGSNYRSYPRAGAGGLI
jgi:ABC-type transport system substrate-binding protein